MPEKRKYRRLALSPLRSRVFQEGELIDLSIGGAFVTSERPLPKGSALTLEFMLPAHGLVRIGTLVEWTGDYFQGETGDPCPGMGLSFVAIEAEVRIAITRYLAGVYEVSQAARRVRTKLPARVNAGGRWQPASVRELAERTLFLETALSAPLGGDVDILIRLPALRAPIEARGVVLQVGTLSSTARPLAPGDGAAAPKGAPEQVPQLADDPRGLRIALSEVGLRAREQIRSFIEDAREDAAQEAAGS